MATVAAATPAYRDLLTGLPQRVNAYTGVPLVTRRGEVFGTLCGVAPRAQSRALACHLPLVEMTARLLSTLLPADEPAQPPAHQPQIGRREAFAEITQRLQT